MCIEHTLAGDKDGYGRISFRGRTIGLHRLVLADKLGVDPYHLSEVVRHSCDNTRCIDPDHLLEGTHQDNINDAVARGRNAKGEDSGRAKLTEDAVADIRTNYRRYNKEFGIPAFARKYGISRSTVFSALAGETWAKGEYHRLHP